MFVEGPDEHWATLEVLYEHYPGWLFGLEIVKLSEGRIKRGTVYVILSHLETDGLVESELSDTHLGKRRRYRLTTNGRRKHEERQEAQTSLADNFVPAH